jgi:hypothetical protein
MAYYPTILSKYKEIQARRISAALAGAGISIGQRIEGTAADSAGRRSSAA